jgi:integrase
MGGRGNALRNIKVDDIHRDAQTVLVRETKIGKTVEKDLFAFVMELIWQYVIDYDIKTALFYWNLDAYNDRLIQASKDAGLPESKRITSHMLKHTCVTQMSLHGVDIDVISDYVETDPATLMAFYRGGGREKVRAQILNLPRTEEKWIEFVRKLHPYFVERYNYIKPFAAKVDGIKARVPPK